MRVWAEDGEKRLRSSDAPGASRRVEILRYCAEIELEKYSWSK